MFRYLILGAFMTGSAAASVLDKSWELVWSEAKISQELIEEIGSLSALKFSTAIREKFGIRSFICEPGKETFRQHDGPNPVFNGINDLEEDKRSLELYCASFRSPETQMISGLFLRADTVFQPNDELPALQRNYPIILTWTVALRETLIHEFIHYLIENSPERLDLFKFYENRFEAFWKKFEDLQSELARLNESKADAVVIMRKERELALYYLPELVRTTGEELDVYRFMIEQAPQLGLSHEDVNASLIGYYSRLQEMLAFVFDYLYPLLGGPQSTKANLKDVLLKLKASYDWYSAQEFSQVVGAEYYHRFWKELDLEASSSNVKDTEN